MKPQFSRSSYRREKRALTSRESTRQFLRTRHWNSPKECCSLSDSREKKFSSFHSNGSEKENGLYNENKKDGKWITWYGNGYKMMEQIYKDGTLIAKKSWNDDGSKKE